MRDDNYIYTISKAEDTDEDYYYQILSEFSGLSIVDEYELMQQLKELAEKKQEYDKIRNALEQVRARGYGVVPPERSEIVTSSRRATASRIVSPVLYSTRTGASAKPSVVTPSAEVSAARTKYPSFSALAGA